MSEVERYSLNALMFSSLVILSYARQFIINTFFPEEAFFIGLATGFLDAFAIGGPIGLYYGIKASQVVIPYGAKIGTPNRKATVAMIVGILSTMFALPQLFAFIVWIAWVAHIIDLGHF